MTSSSTQRPRFDAPDLVRGLIMVIMLLDHVRDFTHASGVSYDPTDLTRTTVPLFFTRWVTHFCAPLFVFLAGMSVAFQQQRGKTGRELSVFLLKRGLWLIVLELLVFRSLIFWNVAPTFFFLQVIWVFGVSMICLAAFVRLPRTAVLVIGAALVLGHNALDGVQVAGWNGPDTPVPSALAKLWMFAHQPGAFPILGWPSPVVYALYPLIPWIGVMALGWLLGGVYTWDATRRRTVLVRLGFALTVAFVLLRLSNVYGDPRPWQPQDSFAFSVLSFLNAQKYPPSLLFLLMTIGPGLIALAWFERRDDAKRGPIARALIVYGRVPLFFYILQWVYAKSAGFALAVMAGHNTALFHQFPFDWDTQAVHGFSLGVSYAVWAAGAILLYWPCRWFAEVKARRRDWWLSYL